MPKLYFYDTGLACALLGLESEQQLETHYLRGSLFENLVINELLKFRFNQGRPSNLYFWRDKTGHEIDCIYELADRLIPIEIKASKTLSTDYFKSLLYFQNISQQNQGVVCYAGEITAQQQGISITNFTNLVSELEKSFQ